MMRRGSVFVAACLSAFGVFGATAIQTALDNMSLTFATGGDAEWFSQSSEVHAGTTALRSGAISDNQETWVRTAVKGAGQLTFAWRVSSESVNWDWLEVSVDGVTQDGWKIGGYVEPSWTDFSIPISGTGIHSVKWRYRKDGSAYGGEDCGWLDDVRWTGNVPSASDKPSVTFELNGGEWPDVAPVVFAGDTYADLPKPVRQGSFFSGWFKDAQLSKRASGVIPTGSSRAYAKWGVSVSQMDASGIAFSSEGDFWWAAPNAGHDGGYAAQTDVEYNGDSSHRLVLSLTGPGTLEYKWRTDATSNPWLYYMNRTNEWDWQSFSTYFDAGAAAGRYKSSDATYVDGWKVETLRSAAAGAHSFEFWANNYYSSASLPRFELSDFIWTPAPSTIRVTYVVNGGSSLASETKAPGVTFAGLPTPTRAGYEFAGWHLDSELIMRGQEDEMLPFEESVTVYAKWIRPVPLMDDGGIAFSSEGNYWWAAPNAGHDGGYAAQTDVAYGRSDRLVLSLTGSGTLEYKWRTDATSNSSLCYMNRTTDENYQSFSTYFDADVAAGRYKSPGETYVDGWKVETLRSAAAGVHTFEFWANNYSSASLPRFELSDFVWTPAPSAIRVTYAVNGGDALDPDELAPGVTFGELPVPERAGYEFLGWYMDSALKQFGSAEELLPFEADVTVYAKWGRSVSLMNTESLEFETGGDVPWTAEEGAGASGGPAAVVEIPYTDNGTLMSSLYASGASGRGTLSFKWRIDPLDKEYWSSGNFVLYVDGEEFSSNTWSWEKWNKVEIPIVSEDDHSLEWMLENWSDRPIRYRISDIVWTPAPDEMTVSFNSDGGSKVGSIQFTPGDFYGELPKPTKSGWTFAGWRRGSVMGEDVRADELVPFEESIQLFARWERAVSYMTDADLTFKTGGDLKFKLTNVKSSSGKNMAGVRMEKVCEMGSYAYRPENYPIADKTPYLSTTVKGPVFLSFEWLAVAQDGTQALGWFTVDGEDVHRGDYCYDGSWVKEYRVFIPEGKHTLRWNAYGWPNFTAEWDEEAQTERFILMAAPSLYVGDIKVEKVESQKTLAAWAGKLHDYDVFVTGDPAKFKKTYADKIRKNAKDYEARVFHAISTLMELSENGDFKKFAKTFGFTVDYGHCRFVGSPKFNSKTAGMNDMVDKALKVVVPALETALDDLKAIPETWTGSVKLDANKWPVDETVFIDRADVRYARASLEAAIGMLYYLGGYDLTVDWKKSAAALDARVDGQTIANLPDIDDDLAWSQISPLSVGENDGYFDLNLASVRAVRCGTKLVLLLEYAEELDSVDTVDFISLTVRAGEKKLDFFGEGLQSDWESWYLIAGGKEVPVSGETQITGNRIMVEIDCSKVSDFSKGSWAMRSGSVVMSCENGIASTGSWRGPEDDFIYQKHLIEQTKFLSKVRNADRLATSKSWVKKALKSALAADGLVCARTDDESHFIEYDPALDDRLALARENTRQALDSLDGPVAFDLPQMAETYERCEDFDYTLLPDDGLMRVYLGALFKGKVTRKMKPVTYLNAFGQMNADFESLSDPTFGGLFPYLAREHFLDAQYEYSDFEETPAINRKLIPGESVSLGLIQYIGYSVDGLPKGLSWDKKTGVLTGVAPGKKFTLKFSAGGMTRSEAFQVGPKPELTVAIADGGEGIKSVTGGGAYAANEKVKVIAAVKSGYAFGGWYDEADNLVSPDASYSLVMPLTDYSLRATAVFLDDDYLDVGYEDSVDLAVKEKVLTDVGTYFDCRSGSPYTLSVKDLPDGVKLKRAEDWTYYLSGAPKTAGVYYASFNAKNNGGFKNSFVIRFVVGGAEEKETNKAKIDLSGLQEYEPYTGYEFKYETTVPDSSKNGAVKKIKVSGLPTGWKAKTTIGSGCIPCGGAGSSLSISGCATKAGLFTIKVTVTYANGKTAVTEKKVIVYDSGSVYVPVKVCDGQTSRGKVSGGGVYAYGATVTLKATPKDGYAFAGWYCADAFGLRPCYELGSPDDEWRVNPAEFVLTLSEELCSPPFWSDGLTAMFVTKDEDFIAINCEDSWKVVNDEVCDTAYTEFPIAVESVSMPTLKASNLPDGIKLSGSCLRVSKASALVPGTHVVTLTAKNLSGNSAKAKVKVIVPNLTDAVDRGYLDLDTSDIGYCVEEYDENFRTGVKVSMKLSDLGIWLESGWELSVTGLPKGWKYTPGKSGKLGKITGTATEAGPKTVTFTVKKGTKSYKATATFDLSPLPDWAVGTFIGSTRTYYPREDGYEDGTLKLTVDAKGAVSGSYTMSGDGSKTSFSGTSLEWDEFQEGLYAKVKGQVDGATKTFLIWLGEEDASFEGTISKDEEIFTELLTKNPWTGPSVDKSTLPKFADKVSCSFEWMGFYKGSAQDGTVSLAFGEKGAVSGKFETKKGTVSAALQLAGFEERTESSWSGYLVVGIPANKSKKIASAYCYVPFFMEAGSDGLVHEVQVDGEVLGFGSLW